MHAHCQVFEKKLNFLKTVDAFRDLSPDDLFNISVCMNVQKVRVGHSIVKEGDQQDPLRFFIIVKRGEVEVRSKDNEHIDHATPVVRPCCLFF